jgi:hypothetical protein
MAGKAYQFIVRAGPNPGKIYPIIKNEVIIGRDPTTDILINDAEVSRHHAVVKLTPEGYTIEDLGSTNGTIINNQRLLGPHILHTSEIINLGEHISLVFEVVPEFDPDATMVSRMPIPPAPPLQKPFIPPSNPVVMQSSSKPAAQGSIPPASSAQRPSAINANSPDDFPEDVPIQTGKKNLPKWLLPVLIGTALLTILCIVIVLTYIDKNYLWCNFLPFLTGCK